MPRRAAHTRISRDIASSMARPVERVDCLVVGAGVIGMAVARALALKGREVCVSKNKNATYLMPVVKFKSTAE